MYKLAVWTRWPVLLFLLWPWIFIYDLDLQPDLDSVKMKHSVVRKLSPGYTDKHTDTHSSQPTVIHGHYRWYWWLRRIIAGLVRWQFCWHGDWRVGLGRATARHPQTGRVFSIRTREQVAVKTGRVGSVAELTGSLAVAPCSVWPVLGLHELEVERPVTTRRCRTNSFSALRHPEWIDHVVRWNAAHHLHTRSHGRRRTIEASEPIE